MLEKAREAGESEEALAERKATLDGYMELYRNPAINAAITFLETVPVALVVPLVSAGVLSRRRNSGAGRGAVSGTVVSM